jgi:hypothetical protein
VSAKRTGIGTLGHQMKVIGHKHVSEQGDVESSEFFADQPSQLPSSPLVEEMPPAPIHAGGDVEDFPRTIVPPFASHTPKTVGGVRNAPPMSQRAFVSALLVAI